MLVAIANDFPLPTLPVWVTSVGSEWLYMPAFSEPEATPLVGHDIPVRIEK